MSKVDEILEAVYITDVSKNKRLQISTIVNNSDELNITKATDICDLLGIARRSNRAAIKSVLCKE